jgi:aspartate aminotransferase
MTIITNRDSARPRPDGSTAGAGSRFGNLPAAPADEAFLMFDLFDQDTHPDKVTLGGGVYRTDEGAPWPLPAVRAAETRLHAAAEPTRHEYTSMLGDPRFLRLAQDLIFCLPKDDEQTRARVASCQTISGTGANHIGALFFETFLKPRQVWVADPTWVAHTGIWAAVGTPIRTYPYYDSATRSFCFDRMMSALSEAHRDDVVVLQAAAHNPTGLDPTRDQWKEIAALCQARGLVPFFDCAYQGFASGDPVEDTWSVSYFLGLGIEMGVAQSFSKNMGLYGQRVGAFHLVLPPQAAHARGSVLDNFCLLIRGEYSVPPRGGATIAREILASDDLHEQWLGDLKVMSNRIKKMRQALYDELVALQTPGTWEHIIRQIGMFSYLGLSAAQVSVLKDKYHIYAMSSGRASISGLNPSNVKYVAKAIDDVVRTVA